MTHKTLTQADLALFTGTEHWYRHPLAREVLYTDGVQHVAECGGAYWLLDEIALRQLEPAIAAQTFQLWKLEVGPERRASLTCEDGDGLVIFTRKIDYTDFPLDAISFFFVDHVLLLPSEY